MIKQEVLFDEEQSYNFFMNKIGEISDYVADKVEDVDYLSEVVDEYKIEVRYGEDDLTIAYVETIIETNVDATKFTVQWWVNDRNNLLTNNID